jgi:hypothetical protein
MLCVEPETEGFGFTLIKKEFDPVQPDLVPETFMVAVCWVVVVLVDGHAEIELVEPEAASPIEVLLFVQENVAPAGRLVKFNGPTWAPAHTVISAGTVITGTGFTVNVVDAGVKPHSFVTVSYIV